MLQVFSKSVHPAVLSTFAERSRVQICIQTTKKDAPGMQKSSVTPSSMDGSPGQFSGMVWGQPGLMAQQLAA